MEPKPGQIWRYGHGDKNYWLVYDKYKDTSYRIYNIITGDTQWSYITTYEWSLIQDVS